MMNIVMKLTQIWARKRKQVKWHYITLENGIYATSSACIHNAFGTSEDNFFLKIVWVGSGTIFDLMCKKQKEWCTYLPLLWSCSTHTGNGGFDFLSQYLKERNKCKTNNSLDLKERFLRWCVFRRNTSERKSEIRRRDVEGSEWWHVKCCFDIMTSWQHSV